MPTYVSMQENISTPRPPKAKIEIHYCCQCQWLLRAAWMAQELLSTFADDLECVALAPKTGGTFEIYYQVGAEAPILSKKCVIYLILSVL